MITTASYQQRCSWCGNDPLYQHYHDHEWGVPSYHADTLFEFLLLEGQQAGLAWITVLKKREALRQAYANFDPVTLAHFSDQQLIKLQQNPAIIRHRLKIKAARNNARAWLALEQETDNVAEFLWQFVGARPLQNHWRHEAQIPTQTEQSVALSQALKQRGFSFVGPTIMYAYMQAVGMVNDHVVSCHRHQACAELSR